MAIIQPEIFTTSGHSKICDEFSFKLLSLGLKMVPQHSLETYLWDSYDARAQKLHRSFAPNTKYISKFAQKYISAFAQNIYISAFAQNLKLICIKSRAGCGVFLQIHVKLQIILLSPICHCIRKTSPFKWSTYL